MNRSIWILPGISGFSIQMVSAQCLLRFLISRSRSLSPFFSLSFAGLSHTFSFSRFFFCSIFQTADMTVTLSLIIKTTRIQKQFLPSFSSLLTLKLSLLFQDTGGYAISRQNSLKLHLGCPTCWLSYFTLVCPWCGRTVGRAYGHVITKFSRMDILLHFLTHGAPLLALFPLIATNGIKLSVLIVEVTR